MFPGFRSYSTCKVCLSDESPQHLPKSPPRNKFITVLLFLSGALSRSRLDQEYKRESCDNPNESPAADMFIVAALKKSMSNGLTKYCIVHMRRPTVVKPSYNLSKCLR